MSLRPTTLLDVQDMVRQSASLRVRGAGTKSSTDGHDVLDTTLLSGITEYSPDECVFTALPGTPLRDLERVLAPQGQYLPFDPPLVDAGATIGGTVAAGVSGSGRYRYGGVRDFIIGVRIVDGEGRAIRSGGKVVKNAAGFLLHHAMVGSRGRFGILTEVTFKVFPRPQARRTLRMECGSVADAWTAARRLEQSRFDCEAIDFDTDGTLTVRIAGGPVAIDERCQQLRRSLGEGDRLLDPDVAVAEPLTRMHAEPGLSCVKVPRPMTAWPSLQPHVRAAHFMCAGSVAWLFTETLDGLAHALTRAQLAGHVVRGPRAGALVGHVPHNEFEARVLRVLDPHDKFSATPHSTR